MSWFYHPWPEDEAAATPLARPIRVTLADTQDRRTHQLRQRQPKSFYTRARVVGPGIAFHGPGVRLAEPVSANRLNRRQAKSRLSPPAVVTIPTPFVARPIQVELAPSSRKARASHPSLPKVIYAARVYAPISGYLTKPRDTVPPTHSHLRPPIATPVVAELARPIAVALAPHSRGKAKSVLPQVTGGPGIAFRGPRVKLAPSSRRGRRATYELAGAFVVNAPPRAKGRTATQFVQPPRIPVHSRLRPPAVTPPSTRPARPIDTTFARIQPRPTDASVFKPAVILEAQGPQGGIGIQLAPQSRGKAKSFLRSPLVVSAATADAVLDITLARNRPAKTIALLRKPTDVVDRDDLGLLRARLTYSLRGKAKPRLAPPTVIAPVLARATDVTLVRIRPAPVDSALRRPVDLVDQQDVGALRVRLAYSIRGKAKPNLGAPVVVAPVLARAIEVSLVRIRPVVTRALLRRPADLVDTSDLGYVRVSLAYSLRGTPKSQLVPPAVVAPVLARPTSTHPAPSLRGTPKSRLGPPTVVAPFFVRSIEKALVRIRPAAVRSILRRPTDLVDQGDLGITRAYLAPSFRGAPKSRLQPPTAVFLFFARPTDITLTRIKPVRTIAILRRPVDLVDLEDVGVVRTHLAYSLRGKAKPFLRAPVVVVLAAPFITPVSAHLTYSLRGTPKPVLRKPVIVASVLARPVSVRLTYGLHGKPKPFLRAPVVVVPVTFFARPLSVNLTYSKRGKTLSGLGRVIVLADTGFPQGPMVAYAPSRRGVPKSVLRKPVAVTAATPYLRAVDVTLVRIRPVRTLNQLGGPTATLTAVAATTSITLAPSRRPRVHSRLSPPETLFTCLRTRFVSRTFLKSPVVISDADGSPGGVPESTYVSDSFTRVATNGWGSPDVGGAWSNTGSHWSVNGASGQWSMLAGTTGTEESFSLAGAPGPMEIAFRWTFGEAWAGNINRIKFRFLTDRVLASRGFMLFLENGTSNRVQMQLRNGAETLISPTVTPWPDGSPDYGNFWWAKVRYERGILYAKAWKDGNPEPGWQITWRPPLGNLGNDVAASFQHFSTVTNTMFMDSISVASLTEGCASGGSLVLPPTPGVYERVRRAPHSRLNPPTVVFPFIARPAITKLARIKPAPVHSVLRKPVVVETLLALPTVVNLAPQSRRKVLSGLGRPAVILPPPAQKGGILTVFAQPPKQARWANSLLRKPEREQAATPYERAIDVTLAPSFRGKPHSFLRPPVVVNGLVVEGVEDVTLAYSVRGKPKSRLAPPTVVAPVLAPSIQTTFARIVPAPIHSTLRRPTDLVDAQDIGIVRTHLSYSSRGVPKSRLFLPTVVFPFIARPTDTTLVRIKPVPTQHALRRPVDLIDRDDLGLVAVTLAYSLRGKPKPILGKPVSIDLAPQTYYLSTTLAPSFRGKPKPILGKPADLVDAQDVGLTSITLAYSRRGVPKSRLNPPTVITAATPYLWPIEVTLVRIRPRRTISMYSPYLLEHCYGIVCGYDYAAKVTGYDSGAKVTGSDTGAKVSGSDNAATVQGASAAGGSVTGGDEKREGC